MVTNVTPGIPRGRGGWSAFRGNFTRQFLVDNGPSSPTAIHQAYRERVSGIGVTSGGVPWRTSTERSFLVWFRMAARLGLIEKFTRTEPPERDQPFLNARTFWDLTPLGRTNEDLWTNVQQALYPLDPETKRAYSTAARGRKKERRERLAELGVAPPTKGRPRGGRPAAPPREVPEAEPLEEAPDVLFFSTPEEVFRFVATTPQGSQDQARDIVRDLSRLGVESSLLATVGRAAENPDWRGTASERRDAWSEFQAVVQSLARALELQEGL